VSKSKIFPQVPLSSTHSRSNSNSSDGSDKEFKKVQEAAKWAQNLLKEWEAKRKARKEWKAVEKKKRKDKAATEEHCLAEEERLRQYVEDQRKEAEWVAAQKASREAAKKAVKEKAAIDKAAKEKKMAENTRAHDITKKRAAAAKDREQWRLKEDGKENEAGPSMVTGQKRKREVPKLVAMVSPEGLVIFF
jgi:hypothetical protein